jgi:NAD-dependent dihydropyrimidine dehydrogenase PreA subunit
MSDPDLPRAKFPWFPTINYDLCASNLECLIFCPHEVFDWEKETGRPIVARPYNCVPGCDMCARNCARGAVTLPSKKQMRALMRKLRAELRRASTVSGG